MARKRLARVCAIGAVSTVTLASGPVGAQGSGTTPFTLSTLHSDSGGKLPLAQVNSGHGCKGGNSPPALQWSAPPAGTKSFAVTMFDLTARKGAGFWHWAVFDIPSGKHDLDLNEMPDGAKAGRNDFGDAGYGGACPPATETHQYQLAVWALRDPTIPFDAGSSDKEVGDFLKTHALGEAEVNLYYKR